MKENEMGGACSTLAIGETYTVLTGKHSGK
jgi:hypothetical protein